jgi:hypothetical protein
MHGLRAAIVQGVYRGLQVLPPQPVVAALSESAVHLGRDRIDVPAPVIAEVKRNRIEAIAQIAQVRQQKDRAVRQRDIMRAGVLRHALTRGEPGVPKMVLSSKLSRLT